MISNGSVIHVYDNQFMILVDGGKVVDYTAEPGYYMVDNSSMPSMFNGQLDESLQEAFNRFRFGGITPMSQKVFYINLQEIRGIKFGTRNPVNYFDNFYNAELFLRAHGTYSVKITNPLLFYGEVAPRDAAKVEIEDINEQFLANSWRLSRRPSTGCPRTGSAFPIFLQRAGNWPAIWRIRWMKTGRTGGNGDCVGSACQHFL